MCCYKSIGNWSDIEVRRGRKSSIIHWQANCMGVVCHFATTYGSWQCHVGRTHTLWCDSDMSCDTVWWQWYNRSIGTKYSRTKHNSVHDQFSEQTVQQIYKHVKTEKKSITVIARKHKITPGKVHQIEQDLEKVPRILVLLIKNCCH